RRRLMHIVERCTGELELSARLEGYGTPAGHIEHADDVAALHDRLPAEQMLHAVEQCMNAALAGIRDGAMIGDGERELFVLGADADLRLRLATSFEPRDEFVTRFYRRHVDLVTSHEEFRRLVVRGWPYPKAGFHFSGSCAEGPRR